MGQPSLNQHLLIDLGAFINDVRRLRSRARLEGDKTRRDWRKVLPSDEFNQQNSTRRESLEGFQKLKYLIYVWEAFGNSRPFPGLKQDGK